MKQIMDSLEWLDLRPDEPPIFQSRREARHAEVARELLAAGRAYLAFEPWRTSVEALRYGADLTLPAGRGDLTAGVRGGASTLGARVSYALPLGDDEE